MRTRVHEQRVLISLTRLEAEKLETILCDYLDFNEIAPPEGTSGENRLAINLRDEIRDRHRDVIAAIRSLSIARGNDRRSTHE